MPGVPACVWRNEDVALFVFFIGRNEAETALGSQINACDAAKMRGLREAVFLIFHDLPALGQALNAIFELLFARAGQQAA